MTKLYLGILLFFSICFVYGAQDPLDPDGPKTSAMLSQTLSWLAKQSGLPPGLPLVNPPDSRIVIPDCPQGFEFTMEFENPRTVKVQCRDTDWYVYLPINYQNDNIEPIYQGNFAAGHRLTTGDVEPEEPEAYWKGQFLRISVRSGQIINTAHLDKGITIYRLKQDIKADVELDDSMFVQEIAASSQNSTAVTEQSTLVRAKLSRNLSSGSILLRRDVKPHHKIVMIKSPIARGALISNENTEISDFWGVPPADSLDKQQSIPRAVSTTQLFPGQALRLSQIRMKPAIDAGEMIEVRIERNLVSITTTMVAENAAEIGERISLRNSESGQIIEGIVLDVGKAIIP
jgi:flagella basal body P-ring formation protein FlgA